MTSEETRRAPAVGDLSQQRTERMPKGWTPQPVDAFLSRLSAQLGVEAPDVGPLPAEAGTTQLGTDGALPTQLLRSRRPSNPSRPRDASGAVDSIEMLQAGLGDLAATLHRLARSLEPAVEGAYSTDLGDPRTRLLADTLAVVQDADLRLARMEGALARLTGDVEHARDRRRSLEQERACLALLCSTAHELNSSLNLEHVLDSAMRSVIDVVRAERGFLLLWDEAAQTLRFAAARRADGEALHRADFAISRRILASVWEARAPLLTTDAAGDEQLQRFESVVAYTLRSVMCVPLMTHGQSIGVVYVDSRTESGLFDETQLDVLSAFCNQAAVAIENARLVSDLRQRMDELAAMKAYQDAVLGSIPSGVLSVDTHGIVTTFNRAAEAILGMATDAVLGEPYQRMTGSIASGEVAAALSEAMTGRAPSAGREIASTLPVRGPVTLHVRTAPLRESQGAGHRIGTAIVLDDLTELRQAQQKSAEIQRLFGQYVHPAVVAQLLANPDAVHLGGETREVSVLFADIRGYTALAERMESAALISLLNEYLDIVTEAIWREEGTLTAYIGDAVMAIFNAPLPQPDHARRAVRAAWALQRGLERYRVGQPGGHAGARYGIGVHTGLAVVGNIGAHGRMQNYTAIGDAVNVAQRLQAHATDDAVLLSEATIAAAGRDARVRPLGDVAVKGKQTPISAFELIGIDPGA